MSWIGRGTFGTLTTGTFGIVFIVRHVLFLLSGLLRTAWAFTSGGTVFATGTTLATIILGSWSAGLDSCSHTGFASGTTKKTSFWLF